MNGTIERPVEEKLESRKSAFTHEEGNIFFSGVLRRYHLESVGKGDQNNGIFESKNLALYSYGDSVDKVLGLKGVFISKKLALFSYSGQNPVRYVDPDGNDYGPPIIIDGDAYLNQKAGFQQASPAEQQAYRSTAPCASS